MKYPIAERFVAPQGEGLYTGTVMAFVRLVGCSVGKDTCTSCDTDFDAMRADMGGGLYGPEQLAAWAADGAEHACLTGGEPLDRDLVPLMDELWSRGVVPHIETSGTKEPAWLLRALESVWLTVSPKPGYLLSMVNRADEVKVILGGLGDGPGWPTLADAVQWANAGKLVYVQPRNEVLDLNMRNLQEARDVVMEHPRLRLSTQMHKVWRTR